MSKTLNVTRSDDKEVAESTDGNEQEVTESATDTGNEQKEGKKERLSKEDRRVQREMARVKKETIGPVNWDVDKIFKGLEKPRDVTAAVYKVLATHDIIHREQTLRRYKAAIAHCINAKPTKIPGTRTYRPGEPTLEGLSCLPVTEYDYKILQASKFFRIKVTTLNNLLIELEELVPSKNTAPLLAPAERAESECSNDEEDERDSSDVAKKRSEEKELWHVEKEENSETEAETEKMPTIVRCDVDDNCGAESADEPVEEAVWDRPMDEVTTFSGDYLDKTKSKEERLRSFVWQVMYHVRDEDDRQCVEWMVQSMLDPPSFAKIPSIYQKTKVLEYYKVILPSLHMSEDFYPVRVDFAPLCGTRRMRFNRPGTFNTDFLDGEDVDGLNIDDEVEDDFEWLKEYEEMEKEREEYAMERDSRRADGVPSDSDDWPESDDEMEVNRRKKMEEEDEEVDVEAIDDEATSGGKASMEGSKMKEGDTATEDSTTESREPDSADDLTSFSNGIDDREETSGADADDEGSAEQQYDDYNDPEYDEDTVEEGDDDDVQCLGDGKTMERPGKEEEKEEETMEKGGDDGKDDDVVVIDEDEGKEEKKKMMQSKKKDEETRKEDDVITLDDDDSEEVKTLHFEEEVEVPEDEEDDAASDYQSVGSRPSWETEGNATPAVALPPLIIPFPAIPSDGSDEEGEVYARPMEGRERGRGARGGMEGMKKEPREEEEDSDLTIMEPPPTGNDDARDESPASPDPVNTSYGDNLYEPGDGEDYMQPASPVEPRAATPQRPIEIAQPLTPQEPERKRRKVLEDEDGEEEKMQGRRRSMRGKASPAPIVAPKKNSRKKKDEKEVIERVDIKKEVVDEGEVEAPTTSRRGRGRGKPTPAKDQKSEEAKRMDVDQKGAAEKEPTTAAQQRPSRRKTMEVKREIKIEVKTEPDEEEEVVIVGSVSSRTRARTPGGRTPAQQKASTPVRATADKKSAAQKRKETMEKTKENVNLIMAMNKDFAGSKPTTPDQSISARTRGSTVKKELVDDDDGGASDASVGSSRRSTRSRGRPPTKEMPPPVLTPSDRSVRKRSILKEIKIEVKEEVHDGDDVASTSQRRPRGRIPAKTPVGKQKATTPIKPNKTNKGEEAAVKKVEVKKEVKTELNDGDEEEDEVKIIDIKPSRAKTPRGRTPAKQKATTPVAAIQPVKAGNQGRKQADLMTLVSTAESRSKPSTPETMRINSSADEVVLSERKKSLRGAKKPVDVVTLEDDEEEKKGAPKQQPDRRRSGRGAGAQAAKSPVKSKKVEEKKQKETMDVMKSKEEPAKSEEKPAPKKPATRKSGPVASFTMPAAQPRRRSHK